MCLTFGFVNTWVYQGDSLEDIMYVCNDRKQTEHVHSGRR